MKKRVISILLAAVTVAALPSPVRAAVADVPQREKAAVLRELEIMVGDETGALHLERDVTRAEFTKLLMAASTQKDWVGDAASTDPYPDVSHKSWYAPYVRAAVDLGLVKGDEQGWFHPEEVITLREGATMAVRLLGYQDADFNAPWPAGQMALYRGLELNAGVSAQNGLDPLTRQDCLHLFYNLLCAKNKAGQDHINLLGSVLNADGEVDVAALFRVEREGPIPLTDGWQDLLPFALDDALIFRDGQRADLGELRQWDLLYWAKKQPILFASSDGQSAMGQLTASVEGPVVAEGNWQAKLPFPVSETSSVTRNGARATAKDIQPQDVVYWSKYAKSLAVYGKTVSGTVEAVSPSLAAPAAVTVAGVPYPLETFEAQYAFSDLGPYRKGDRVRLLLGRTGGVAAVRALEGDEAVTKVGLVSALERRTYQDQNDNPYSAKVIVITGTDGLEYAYPYDWEDEDDFDPGTVVEVSLREGRTSVTRLGHGGLTGTVNATGTQLGRQAISADVEILDTYGKHTRKTVSPARLAGVTLTGSAVRWYATDEKGAITHLILDDVTGDCHRYGIVIEAQSVSIPSSGFGTLSAQSVYTLDLAGQQQVLPASGKSFPVKKGPFRLSMDGQEVSAMANLSQVGGDVTLEGQDALTAGRQRWPLAEDVLYYIYNKESRTYRFASRAQALSGGYTLSAWYDTLPASGGRVRIILAQEK